jgi:hypothetical protein
MEIKLSGRFILVPRSAGRALSNTSTSMYRVLHCYSIYTECLLLLLQGFLEHQTQNESTVSFRVHVIVFIDRSRSMEQMVNFQKQLHKYSERSFAHNCSPLVNAACGFFSV